MPIVLSADLQRLQQQQLTDHINGLLNSGDQNTDTPTSSDSLTNPPIQHFGTPTRDDWASKPVILADSSGSPIATQDTSTGERTPLPAPNDPVTAPLSLSAPSQPLTPNAPVTASLQAPTGVRGQDITPNQFASGLSYSDALAACGPAAAVALARAYGNNIPVSVALNAAKQNGWTQA